MDSIPEELVNLAFDNQAYINMSFPDSGIDSAPSSYENVELPYENVPEAAAEASYENVVDQSYENIDPPLNYQNLDFSTITPTFEDYENLKFQEEEENDVQESYQNVDFAVEPFKAVPVYATLKKAPMGAPIAKAEEEEEGPVYENYDFQVKLVLLSK